VSTEDYSLRQAGKRWPVLILKTLPFPHSHALGYSSELLMDWAFVAEFLLARRYLEIATWFDTTSTKRPWCEPGTGVIETKGAVVV
jgi:hypothetical protein